jgi:hypothetical protein
VPPLRVRALRADGKARGALHQGVLHLGGRHGDCASVLGRVVNSYGTYSDVYSVSSADLGGGQILCTFYYDDSSILPDTIVEPSRATR